MKQNQFHAKRIGAEAEDRACAWLEQQGLILLARNFESRHGEIDLIMREQNILIFVEVRFRSELAWATGRESVDLKKRKRIVACAKFYLLQCPELARLSCRFDVLALGAGTESKHDWIRNAFGDGWW